MLVLVAVTAPQWQQLRYGSGSATNNTRLNMEKIVKYGHILTYGFNATHLFFVFLNTVTLVNRQLFVSNYIFLVF